MKKFFLMIVFLSCSAILCGAEELIESVPLGWSDSAKRWFTAVATVSEGTEPGTLLFTYPITFGPDGLPVKTSWPRVTTSMKKEPKKSRKAKTAVPPKGFWEKYDQIEFELYTRFNRSDEEYLPLTFSISSVKKVPSYGFPIRNLKQNVWAKVSIPLQKMQGNYPVKSVQFHLNAKEYRSGDKLELTVRNFRLIRMMAWQVQKFRMTAPRIFEGTTTLPVEFTLLGPGEKTDLCFEVFNAKGQQVRRSVSSQPRGFAYRTAEIGKLKPGSYKLVLFSSDPRRRQEAPFEVIASPWKN